MYKQIIVVRNDLEMSRGKLISQCCHASLGAWKRTDKEIREKWERKGGKKVILRGESEEDLIMMLEKARELDLSHYMVRDKGLTEIPPNTITSLGIGPGKEEKIDKITGSLPLFK